MRLIDAAPLMEDGWHLVKTGKSNVFLASMSLADVQTVYAVEVVHGRWLRHWNNYICDACNDYAWLEYNYCPNCGADMRERSEGDA